MRFRGGAFIFGYLSGFVSFRGERLFGWHVLVRVPEKSRWDVIDKGRRV